MGIEVKIDLVEIMYGEDDYILWITLGFFTTLISFEVQKRSHIKLPIQKNKITRQAINLG